MYRGEQDVVHFAEGCDLRQRPAGTPTGSNTLRFVLLRLLIGGLLLTLGPGCGGGKTPSSAPRNTPSNTPADAPAKSAQPAKPAKLVLGQPLLAACSAAANGRVYIFGGMDSKGKDVADVLEIDPSAGTIAKRAGMPTPRNSAQAVAVGDKIVLVGGRNAGGMVTSVEIYDPAKNAWEKAGKMDAPVWMHMAAAIGSKVYVMGGISATGSARTSTSAVKILDMKSGTWSNGPDLPAARQGASVGVAGNKIYLFGGRLGGASTSGEATDTVIVLDTGTEKWTGAKKMPATRTSGQSAVIGGKAYIVGGAARGQVTKATDVYDFAADSWSAGPSLKTARSGHCIGYAGNRIYVIGGASGSSVESAMKEIEVVEIK